jgi:uncharacterized protein involved in response to NO
LGNKVDHQTNLSGRDIICGIPAPRRQWLQSLATAGQPAPLCFSAGFRPFFLLGALWAALAILIWLPVFAGEYQIPTIFPPVIWHVHEMVFGHGATGVAGFLLTAIPNFFPWRGVQGSVGGPTVKFLAAALGLHVMSRAQLRELMVPCVVGSALTLAVFFLALLLLPFETFTPFPFPRFPGFF